MTSATPKKELPYFYKWREEVADQYPDYKKADLVHATVRSKLNDVKSDLKYKTQYSTTHDAALGILNDIKVGFEAGGTIGKKEKRFASKFLGMWDPEQELCENLEESLEVLREAKRATFRKIVELDDQVPKLERDEERTRKVWLMESNKLEAIYDELKKKETTEEVEE
jgi:hypothetical protein